MKKIALLSFLAVVFLMATLAFSQGKFTVSGTVEYSGPESIYVNLYDQKTFPAGRNQLPPTRFTATIKSGPSGKAAFTFRDVPPGDYMIYAFVDKNNNKKIDSDAFGQFNEPLISYKPFKDPNRFPSWPDVKFSVDKDITGIEMKF